MLSRFRICLMHSRVLPCIRHRHSSVPKLHDILEYWHRVKKGEATPAVTSEASGEYWKKVQAGTAKPFMADLPAESRSWTIQRGVMAAMRQNFYVIHRNCDTVFDRNIDNIEISFKNRIENCEGEKDLKNLEYEIAGAVSSFSLKDLVYIMDGFLQHNHKPKHLLSVVCKHMAFHFKQEEKTPSRVLHFLYIIGCSRNVPRELLGDIEKYLSEHIHEYTFTDFSVIAFAYMVTNQPIVNYTMLKTMATATLKYFRHKNTCDFYDFQRLAGMYKNFALSRYYDLQFYSEMGDILVRIIPRIRNVRTPQYMAIFRAYAAAGVKHDQLFENLQKRVDINDIYQGIEKTTGLTKSRGTRSKDINRLLWAFGSLGVSVDQVWIDTLLALLSEEDLITQFPHAFVEGLVALTMFGVSPTNLYRKLYEPEVLRAIRVKIKDERLDYYQLLLLHQYIKVMHPEFKQTNVLEKIFKDRRTFEQKLEASLVLKKGLVHYWHSLEEILGSNCVTLKYLIDVSAVLDIVIHLDDNNVPLPEKNQYTESGVEFLDYVRNNIDNYIIEEAHNSIISIVARTHTQSGEPFDWYSELQPLPEPHLLPEKPQKRRKICIRVLGGNQCFKNHPGTFGNISVENHIIRKMGYEILLISPKEAQDMKLFKAEERERYIHEHVLKRLNINTSTSSKIREEQSTSKRQINILD